MTIAATVSRKILGGLGLTSLYRSPLDVKVLCVQRFVRLVAYGASTLVRVAFLRDLGISSGRIGLFMTLTLVGDVSISLLLTLFADVIGRRAILGLGAILMIGSGLIFATSSNYWVLLAAAILGVISPSGNEIGPFRAVEESIVAHLTDPDDRGDVYAWYSLSGNAGTACGMMICGWVIHLLHQDLNKPLLDAYRLVFYSYAVVGLLKFLLVSVLGKAVEAEEVPRSRNSEPDVMTPLVQGDGDRQHQPRRSLLPEISSQSIAVAVTLCTLFAFDSFASGLAPLSWVSYYFKSQYGLEEGRLGSVFFVTNIIAAASMLVASSLAKRFGNVKTMVFTHLPSAIFLALIPVPGTVAGSIVFLVLRACTQSMDVAPRSAFLAAIILPQERTAVLGLINVTKTLSQSLGPSITGLLDGAGLLWVSFICAGCLKACYDLGLLALFSKRSVENTPRSGVDSSLA